MWTKWRPINEASTLSENEYYLLRLHLEVLISHCGEKKSESELALLVKYVYTKRKLTTFFYITLSVPHRHTVQLGTRTTISEQTKMALRASTKVHFCTQLQIKGKEVVDVVCILYINVFLNTGYVVCAFSCYSLDVGLGEGVYNHISHLVHSCCCFLPSSEALQWEGIMCADLRVFFPTSKRRSNGTVNLFHCAATGWSSDTWMRTEITPNKMHQYVYVDESHKEYVMIQSYLSCQPYIPQWQQTMGTNYSVTYC